MYELRNCKNKISLCQVFFDPPFILIIMIITTFKCFYPLCNKLTQIDWFPILCLYLTPFIVLFLYVILIFCSPQCCKLLVLKLVSGLERNLLKLYHVPLTKNFLYHLKPIITVKLNIEICSKIICFSNIFCPLFNNLTKID